MAGNTFKHKILFDDTNEQATLRFPVAYDVIQIQLHVTGTATDTTLAGGVHNGGDLMLISGIDEDGDEVILPGGIGEHALPALSGAFKLHTSGEKVLQFSWKGPALKLHWNKSSATSIVAKVKTFMETNQDVDTGSAYPTAIPAEVGGVTRTLRGN